MQNPTAWLLFVVFGVILFVMYIAIRRRWGSPILSGGLGVIASIVVMTLLGLAQNNTTIQAIVAGLLVGGLFSGGTLAMAYYFHVNEQRRNAAGHSPNDPT
jgi:Na+/H+-translocating membrane pyrophosphatase